MHPTQSQLHADHYNFLRLLACLQSEIACFEIDQTSQLRLPVILDILDYVQVYPERYHHPLENKVFELLLVKNAPNADVIWGTRAEHTALEKITQEANQLFTAVANDTVVPMTELIEVAKGFFERQLDHINIENRIIYPLMDRYIAFDEWEEITQEVVKRGDPIFDAAVREEYHHLYRSILRAERGVVMGDKTAAFAKPLSI